MTADHLKQLRKLVLYYLSRRDHSILELRQKLKQKGFFDDDINPILVEMETLDYINEAKYTENYIHYHRNRGYGPLRIKMQLQAKGISSEMIAQHLELADNAWFIAIQKVWQKYCKGNITKDLKLRAKYIRFLQYRGFMREQIEYVIEDKEIEMIN